MKRARVLRLVLTPEWFVVCDGFRDVNDNDSCDALFNVNFASAAEAGDAARKHLLEHHAEQMKPGRFLARQYCKAFIWGS